MSVNETYTERGTAQFLVNLWNLFVPAGSVVSVLKDDGSRITTKTRSSADMLGSHTPVVWLEGVTGCYALCRCTPVMVDCPAMVVARNLEPAEGKPS